MGEYPPITCITINLDAIERMKSSVDPREGHVEQDEWPQPWEKKYQKALKGLRKPPGNGKRP